MPETVQLLNFLLSLGGVLLFLGASVLIVDYFTSRTLKDLIAKYWIVLGFVLTLSSSIMTLVYSEKFGFVPCGLCWFQRIFLYPQVAILAVAFFYKDIMAARYGIAVSIPGLIVSLYQHYLQMGGSEFVKCPTAGSGADCAQRIIFEFGFMTFPLMSAALFVFLIVLYGYVLKSSNRPDQLLPRQV